MYIKAKFWEVKHVNVALQPGSKKLEHVSVALQYEDPVHGRKEKYIHISGVEFVKLVKAVSARGGEFE